MTELLRLDGRLIEYATWGDPRATPALVLLHEGLGSVAMWREFPARLAEACDTRVVAYSRIGYGRSSPLTSPREPDYMHVEARSWLPRVLDALAIDDCVLFGHSDGASIALIHAAERPARVRGVIAVAPHVYVEDLTTASIVAARDAARKDGVDPRLARYHDDADGAFRGWNDIWLDARFRDWNIEALLPAIAVPVLAIQGRDDEYGTLDQLARIAAQHTRTECLVLDDCRHSPHRDRPDAVCDATARFLRQFGQRTDAR